MPQIEGFKEGDVVQLNTSLKYSIEKNWQSKSSHVVEHKIQYGVILNFHASVEDAVQITYRIKGYSFNTYVHYNDLIVIDEIPGRIIPPAMFDENNLDL